MNYPVELLSKKISKILIIALFFQTLFCLTVNNTSAVYAATISEGDVEIIKTGLRWDRRNQTSYLDTALKNNSQDDIQMPIRVSISIIPGQYYIPPLSVANGDGITDEGHDYFEFGETGETLSPGETTLEKRWIFSNPNRLRFDIAVENITDSSLDPQPQTELVASSTIINSGEETTLTWTSINAETAYIEPDIGSVSVNGSATVSPIETTTYEITATGPGGSATKSLTITVLNPLQVSLTAEPATINSGEQSTLTWTSVNADKCVIEPGIGEVDLNGSITVSPADTTTYTITASKAGETATDSAVITVANISNIPTVNLSVESATINAGEQTVLTWTSSNAAKAYIDNNIGSVFENGSVTISPEHTTTYTITVAGMGGVASAIATVKVTGPPKELPQGSFGRYYQELIPGDATIAEYDSKRFALIRGLVKGSNGSPISDVNISVHEHPEYGTTTTDSIGNFTIPAEGGSSLTIVYEKEGLIPVHRSVYVPWNDFAVVETIQMIEEDSAFTQVTFNGSPNSVFTHRSSPVTTAAGSRSVTVIMTGDNQAFLIDKEGNDVLELDTVNVRASEFPTPATMPAALPPTSAFTYCAEFSIEGAKRVRFAKPVTVLIDNFLGFDVGTIVPVGYYDRDCACWIPEKNGRIAKLLDMNSDGVVDGMDIDGDDQPDDINGNGSISDELTGLENPENYRPNTTFVRFKTNHFTPWDPNHPPRVFYPPNALPVKVIPPYVYKQKNEEDDCKKSFNSYVEERSRVFHEDVPIPGTDFSLHYSTANVALNGKKHLNIQLTGDNVSEILQRVDLGICIAGQRYGESYAPLPNQNHIFKWDGLDCFGNKVDYPVTAIVQIYYRYVNYYGFSNPFENESINLFAKYPERTSEVGTLFLGGHLREFRFKVEPPPPDPNNNLSYLADGWTISNHHHLSPVEPSILKKGDGSKVSTFDSEYKYNRIDNTTLIEALAGAGFAGFAGDNGPAVDAELCQPQGIAIDAAGNVFIADTYNSRIRKIDTDGRITTIAGNGSWGLALPDPIEGGGEGEEGEGGEFNMPVDKVVAIETPLFYPMDVAVDRSGNVYFSDFNPEERVGFVRKVDKEGMLSNVAGAYDTWSSDYGDNQMANSPFVHLESPHGISLDDNCNLYIADAGLNRIRMVDSAGIITTIAGTGQSGFAGDNGSSRDALLNYPTDVKVDRQGNVYIADYYNNVIRRVTPGGFITTIAGTGSPGYTGDNGLATEAQLFGPYKIELDVEGNLYIVDRDNQCIRKVNTSGIIKTISGQGKNPYTEEDNPIDPELLTGYSDIAVDDPGNIFVSFSQQSMIGKIGPIIPYMFWETESLNVYTDKNGLGYGIGTGGVHVKTIDLETGLTLRRFNYPSTVLGSITDQFGNTTEIERDEHLIPTAIISPDGLRTELSIDADRHLTKITFPDETHYDFSYSSDGLMELETDPGGSKFVHVFDLYGKITEILDENGGHWSYERQEQVGEDESILTKVTTAEGSKRTYLDKTDEAGTYTSLITDETGSHTFFEESGMVASKITSCGMEMEFEYDIDPKFKYKYLKKLTEYTPAGLKKSTVTEKKYSAHSQSSPSYTITKNSTTNGKTVTVDHHVHSSEKRATSAENRTMNVQYNPDTFLTERIKIPGVLDTEFEYDSKGRLRFSTVGTRQTELRYNSNGFVETIIDPRNNQRSFKHDAMGRIKEVKRSDNTTLYFDYDANGNMTVLTTPVPADHAFDYNKVNLKTGYTAPLSGSYSFQFDKDRRPTVTTFPSGKFLENVYEPGVDRLDYISTPEGQIDFNYYCGSKVKSLIKGNESISYGYDGKLLTSQTQAGTLNSTLTYGFNNDFLLESFTYAGETETYTYDNDNLLIKNGDFTISRYNESGVNETGFAYQVTDQALTLNRAFNDYGEIKQQRTSVSGQEIFTWDVLQRYNDGKIKSKAESIDGSTSIFEYNYDTMGRLLTVTKDGTLVEEYQYAPNGSRKYEMNSLRGISGRVFAYSDEDHLLTAGSASYQYDLDGFLTSKTEGTASTLFNYSSRGELMSVTLPDSTQIEFIHDPLGRRIAKKVNGITTEKYLWNGFTQLLAVYDGNDNLVMRFEYADGRMPVAMTKSGILYYLAYDQVGSLTTVADISGNVLKRVEYDSFGNIINDTAPAFEVPFGFAGGLLDNHTGLVRFGYRDYDPDTGRWTAKDPILFNGEDTDLYGYCLNDPINFVDPEGTLAHAIAGVLFAAGYSAVSEIISQISSCKGEVYDWGKVAKKAVIGGALGGASMLSLQQSLGILKLGSPILKAGFLKTLSYWAQALGYGSMAGAAEKALDNLDDSPCKEEECS